MILSAKQIATKALRMLREDLKSVRFAYDGEVKVEDVVSAAVMWRTWPSEETWSINRYAKEYIATRVANLAKELKDGQPAGTIIGMIGRSVPDAARDGAHVMKDGVHLTVTRAHDVTTGEVISRIDLLYAYLPGEH